VALILALGVSGWAQEGESASAPQGIDRKWVETLQGKAGFCLRFAETRRANG